MSEQHLRLFLYLMAALCGLGLLATLVVGVIYRRRQREWRRLRSSTRPRPPLPR